MPRQTIKSLDQLDCESFKAGAPPEATRPRRVTLAQGVCRLAPGYPAVSLDGIWEMAEGGTPEERLNTHWEDALPANVPGSVHTALVKAGKLPDPTVGTNDRIAREMSFKAWWFKRVFSLKEKILRPCLQFDGVAVTMTAWLDGVELGRHEGMFGGPEFPLPDLTPGDHALLVRVDPAPYVESTGQPNSFFTGMNVGWLYTTVFNNVYGWHYSNIPSIGIWRSVRLERGTAVKIRHPFVATRDIDRGTIDLHLTLEGASPRWRGQLTGVIAPDNFVGEPFHFTLPISSRNASRTLRLRMDIPERRLWWPVDHGFPHLYRLNLSFTPGEIEKPEVATLRFGIRTIDMAPLPDGPDPEKYNWTFVVNGKPLFVKGANWCTMDPLMDFSRERYDRFIKLATNQHVQLLRAWGSGMPETDDFYDLTDRYGVMVLQEWPTAWNSHREGWQPYALLEETVRRNMLRLRNHPSLIMWGGGNESDDPFGPAIDLMGQLSVELDHTRPFHRGEPWGGSLHNYDCWWGNAPLDRNLSLAAAFLGEFGLASLPDTASVLRYLPEAERDVWPLPEDSTFAHHTPVFNLKEDLVRLVQYSGYFARSDSLSAFVFGSQMAQATGVRHTLELARSRWPECTGALYYKLNDNYPAASWSSIDWYGATKLAYHAIQDAFAPLHACVLFTTLQPAGEAVTAPVYLLDDREELVNQPFVVTVRVYDALLVKIERQVFSATGTGEPVTKLGNLYLSEQQTVSCPLLIVSEINLAGVMADRTFYWLNFAPAEGPPGSDGPCGNLLALPKTSLRLTRLGAEQVRITNTGSLPAVGVQVMPLVYREQFTVSDGLFWLDAGESRELNVTITEGLSAIAWNGVG